MKDQMFDRDIRRVAHHQRRPGPSHVSIERLFGEIRKHFGTEWDVHVSVSPQPSRGVLPRLHNLAVARATRAQVHHIVGDVHYLAFSLPPERLILTIHDCAALDRLSGFRHSILKYLWFTGPMSRAAIVTTISESTKAELCRWVGQLAEKVRVIPNCVGSEFQPTEKIFDVESPVVLQVGTGWNKNVERVAEALSGTGCSLEIVGCLSPQQRTLLESTGTQFTELGRVSDDELLAAYHRCDLVVFASLYEGFGLPILEAQAVGRPVITSSRASMPEVAGAGALLVDPESVNEIRVAVQGVIENEALRQQLVKSGFDNVRRYRPDQVARRYADLYSEVAERQP